MRKLVILGLFITTISYQNKFESEINREIQVINDIFLQIPEKITFYNYNTPIPPPPPLISSEYDTPLYEKLMNEYELELKKIDYDTSIVILVFYDTLISGNTKIDHLEHYLNDTTYGDYSSILNSLIRNEKEPFIVDLNSITQTGKYRLKYYSEFPQGKQFFREEYNFNFGGFLLLSRIYFNETYDMALLYCEYACGIDCSTGNIILLEKVDTKWTIQEVRMIWIS